MSTSATNPARVSHAMFETATLLTDGYAAKEFTMWISEQGIMYLTIYNIVYNIDLEGDFVARRKSDGEPLTATKGEAAS